MIFKNISIKDTDLKGRGIFTNERIHKGEKVLNFEGPFLTDAQARELRLQDHVVPVGVDQYINAGEPEFLINHSCEPNTGFSTDTTLIALQDIEPDEELTFDYSTVTTDDWTMNCNCGAKNCRGKIGNFKDLPFALQEKYKDITPRWVLESSKN